MEVDLTGSQEVFVTFQNCKFFASIDAVSKNLKMNGLGFMEEMSVEYQRYNTHDSNITTTEANQITKPKRALRFEVNGVQILN